MSSAYTAIRSNWASRGWPLASGIHNYMIRRCLPHFTPQSVIQFIFWRIALTTDLEKKEESSRSAVELFMRLLDVDEKVAAALAGAELTTIEEVAYIPLAALLEIDAIELALVLAHENQKGR